MFNSNTARLGVVKPDLKPLPPSTLQYAYGQRQYEKFASQLNSGDDALKKKVLEELQALLKSPQNCVEALRAGVIDVLLRVIQTPPVELRGSAVEALQQFLLSPAGRKTFHNPAALALLCEALFPLLHDEDLSLRRTVMECLRVAAAHKDSALLLASSGIVLDLLIQTAWKSEAFQEAERLKDLKRLPVDIQGPASLIESTFPPRQDVEATLKPYTLRSRTDLSVGKISCSASSRAGRSLLPSGSRCATDQMYWNRFNSSNHKTEGRQADQPPAYSRTPTTTTSRLNSRSHRTSWRALRVKRVHRRQWAATERSIRVRWGKQSRTFTFHRALEQLDTGVHGCEGGAATASTSGIAGAGNGEHPGRAGATAADGELQVLQSPAAEIGARVGQQAGDHVASVHLLQADSAKEDTLRAATGSLGSHSPSWKHLRPRKNPRRRWVATERAVCMRGNRTFSFIMGLHRQDEDSASDHAASAAIPVGHLSHQQQDRQTESVETAEQALGADQPAFNGTAMKASCSRTDLLKHSSTFREKANKEVTAVAAVAVTAETPAGAKEAAVSSTATARDRMVPEDETIAAVGAANGQEYIQAARSRILGASKGVLLRMNTSVLREATSVVGTTARTQGNATKTQTNDLPLVKDCTRKEVDSSLLLTRAAAADLAYTVLLHVEPETAAALLAQVSPSVFLYLFLRSFGASAATEDCPSSRSSRAEAPSIQQLSTVISSADASQQVLNSCTRLVTLVCREAIFREALVEGKLLIYLGDMFKALLEIQFPLEGNEPVKRNIGLHSEGHCGRRNRSEKRRSQLNQLQTEPERGKLLLLQQLAADGGETKTRKAFFYRSLLYPDGAENGALQAEAADECRGELLAVIASLSLSIEGKRQCAEHFLLAIAAACFLETTPNNLGYALQVIVNVSENRDARKKLLSLLLPHLTDMQTRLHTLTSDADTSAECKDMEIPRLQRSCKRAIDALSRTV